MGSGGFSELWKSEPDRTDGALVPLVQEGNDEEFILSDLHIQRIVPPSYILDVPCPDLKSLYLR